MTTKLEKEICRVHDLVRTSLSTAQWIVSAVSVKDSRRKPPDCLLVRGLVELAKSDPGESTTVTDAFAAVADTCEDVGLPAGFPATSWHFAAGQIVARVLSTIVNPNGAVSRIAGVSRSDKSVEIDKTALRKWWPEIRKQLKPLTTIRFNRLHDLLIQEYNRAASEAAKRVPRRQPPRQKQRKKSKAEIESERTAATREAVCELVESALIGRPFLLARFKFLSKREYATRFETIGEQGECWRNQGADVARGLKALRDALNEIVGAPSLTVSLKNKTAILVWPI